MRLPALLFSFLLIAGVAVAQDPDISRATCADCHDEAETFAAGPHGSLMAAKDPAILERSCTTCHGPADQHIEDPSPENIHRYPDASACETCHQGKSRQLGRMTPAHQRHEVSCLNCHGPGHEATDNDYLFRETPFETCGGCHTDKKTAASLPFAHRNGTAPFDCTSCHSLHGVVRSARLAFGESTGTCLGCHTEKEGPFVFPHPPREVDGCVACHSPHGSPNPRLLKRRSISSLCLECHANVPSFHNLARSKYQACTSCHNAIHGSNRNQRLFD